MGEIGDEKALQPLLSLLVNESEDEYFRGNYVAVALGKIKNTQAVEPLIELELMLPRPVVLQLSYSCFPQGS